MPVYQLVVTVAYGLLSEELESKLNRDERVESYFPTPGKEGVSLTVTTGNIDQEWARRLTNELRAVYAVTVDATETPHT